MDKIIVNIASYNRIDSLIKSLKSIYNQCDEINLCLNSHSGDIPEFLYSPKINLTFTDNSKGDAFKFLFLKQSNGYYLTIDDDLIYPSDYVEYMISSCKKYENKKIVTLHGRNFNRFPISSYYNSANERYSFFKKLKKDSKVQFGGTGVMCFHTSILKIDITDFKYPNMADVWIGKFAMERNIDIICLQHRENYINYIPQKETIYDTQSSNDKIQTRIVNKIFSSDKKNDLSVIIPTYKNINFLDESIISVLNATLEYNIEILIGVDGCEESLEFLKESTYPNYVKMYYFEDNMGPYTIKNTLAEKAKSENLLFFDSDDIMNQNMIQEIINGLKNYICVKPKFSEFGGKSLGGTVFGEGVFGIQKNLFMSMNGFEPWMMAADSDFMGRLYKKKLKILHTPQILFKRRVHPDSLTNRKDTGLRSIERARYFRISKNKKGDGNPEILHKRDYIVIDTKTNENLLVIRQRELENRKQILDSVLNPQPRKVVIKQNKKGPQVTNDNRLDFLSQPKKVQEKITHNNPPENRQDLINKKKSQITKTIRDHFPKKTNNREGKNMINLGGKNRI